MKRDIWKFQLPSLLQHVLRNVEPMNMADFLGHRPRKAPDSTPYIDRDVGSRGHVTCLALQIGPDGISGLPEVVHVPVVVTTVGRDVPRSILSRLLLPKLPRRLQVYHGSPPNQALTSPTSAAARDPYTAPAFAGSGLGTTPFFTMASDSTIILTSALKSASGCQFSARRATLASPRRS